MFVASGAHGRTPVCPPTSRQAFPPPPLGRIPPRYSLRKRARPCAAQRSCSVACSPSRVGVLTCLFCRSRILSYSRTGADASPQPASVAPAAAPSIIGYGTGGGLRLLRIIVRLVSRGVPPGKVSSGTKKRMCCCCAFSDPSRGARAIVVRGRLGFSRRRRHPTSAAPTIRPSNFDRALLRIRTVGRGSGVRYIRTPPAAATSTTTAPPPLSLVINLSIATDASNVESVSCHRALFCRPRHPPFGEPDRSLHEPPTEGGEAGGDSATAEQGGRVGSNWNSFNFHADKNERRNSE
jgi:hypothetical protein